MSKLGGALRRFFPATLHWRSLAGVSSLFGAPPAAMVPLSLLESVQATLAAQLADLRADAKAALADAKADAKAAMATQRSDAAARLKRELEQSQQLSAASYQALQLYGQHALIFGIRCHAVRECAHAS